MAEIVVPPGYEELKSGLVVPTTMKADALSDLRHPTAWLLEWARSGSTLSGISINHQSAMGLPTYYACIRAISEDIGKTPMITYQRLKPRGKERALDHSNYALLHDSPNEDMEALTFKETLTAHALAWGNGYAEIARNTRGEAIAMYPIHPSRVLVRRDEEGRIVYDVFGTEQITGASKSVVHRLRSENILHIRGLGAEGLIGYSVLQIARESIGLSLAAQHFGAAFFGNGAHIGGVLEHPQVLSDTALKHLRESWAEMYIGTENTGKPAILEEGMKWSAISLPPEQAQYLQTRAFQRRDIASWFRMPLHKVQDMADASYNNIEHQSLDYVTDTLMPWFVRWEQQVQRKLFRNDPEYFAEHLLLGLLRSDQKARANFYRVMFNLAAISPNEIREFENMNPIGPDGDTYFIAVNNLMPIQNILRPPVLEEEEKKESIFEPLRPQVPVSPNGRKN